MADRRDPQGGGGQRRRLGRSGTVQLVRRLLSQPPPQGAPAPAAEQQHAPDQQGPAEEPQPHAQAPGGPILEADPPHPSTAPPVQPEGVAHGGASPERDDIVGGVLDAILDGGDTPPRPVEDLQADPPAAPGMYFHSYNFRYL